MSPGARAEPFTLVVMPDTQSESTNAPQQKFPAMTKWIVDHRAERNIPFVAHVGDLVNWETPNSVPSQFQYVNADAAMSLLDVADIPYAIAVGNHDTAAVGGVNPDGTACHCGGSAGPGNVHENVRNTSVFNQFFPLSRFTALEGQYEAGKVDNTFHTFKAGGLDWLVLTGELDPRPGALAWANQVVAAHPDHNVIYLTHNYLAPSGDLAGAVGYADLSPQKVWDGLIKLHSNIRFVLCGHLTETALRQTAGDGGQPVYQILTDYQNLGEGWLRTLEIDTAKKTVKSEVYSPYLDEHKTGPSEAFTLKDVVFIPSADPVVPVGGAGGMSGSSGVGGAGAGGLAGPAGGAGMGSGDPNLSGGVTTGGMAVVPAATAGAPSGGNNAAAPVADAPAADGCACRIGSSRTSGSWLGLSLLLGGRLWRRRGRKHAS